MNRYGVPVTPVACRHSNCPAELCEYDEARGDLYLRRFSQRNRVLAAAKDLAQRTLDQIDRELPGYRTIMGQDSLMARRIEADRDRVKADLLTLGTLLTIGSTSSGPGQLHLDDLINMRATAIDNLVRTANLYGVTP